MPLELSKACEASFPDDPGPRAFPMLCTWDSDIPSSCEMKDEPAVKPLQGNTAFFRVRASCCPFHLRQHNQGPSNILIAERILLLMCLLKGGFPLESKPDNQLSSRDDLQYMEFSSCCYAERGVLNLGPCSGEIWSYLSEGYLLVMFDCERRMALEPMLWNRASSHGEGEVSFFFLTFMRNMGYILT